MATTQELKEHFSLLLEEMRAAQQDILNYEANAEKWTAQAKTDQLAKITTVRATIQHASNCSICTAWED